MPLKKTTQAVISPNICTTDTDQTIDGEKAFTQTITGDLSGNVTGNVTGNLQGSVVGNASTSTTLQTARTINISGSVTGTATSFDGSANIIIPVTITSGASIPSPAIASPQFAGTATGTLTSNVIQGVTDGINASAGIVGEIIQSPSVAAAAITTGAVATGATINLTAGDWDVEGSVTFNFTGTVVTANSTIAAGISTTAALVADQQQLFLLPAFASTTLSPAFVISVPVTRQILTGNQAVNIIVKAPTFTGTVTRSAFIRARRIR